MNYQIGQRFKFINKHYTNVLGNIAEMLFTIPRTYGGGIDVIYKSVNNSGYYKKNDKNNANIILNPERWKYLIGQDAE